MIHSILICEVEDRRSHVLQALWKIANPKNRLKCHVELNFNNFPGKKMENVYIHCYDILIVGIGIIGFDVNRSSTLLFNTIFGLIVLQSPGLVE